MKRAISLLLGVSVLALEGRVGADAPNGMGPEILHMPLLDRHAEQGILRPVPISVDLPEELALKAKRVLLHYRLWGEPDWTTLELRRKGTHFEGAIPCTEVSTVTGDLRYYIRVHDVEGHVIASAASLAKPYVVVIKHDTTLAEGQRKAAKCPDPADCPRGLPGCPSERVIDVPCRSDADCNEGSTCGFKGVCERITRRRNWLSASIEQGFGVLSRAGSCSLYAQENEGLSCIRDDDKQYVGSPILTDERPAFATAPTRVLVGYDRLVDEQWSVGVRVGLVIHGQGPTARDGTAFVPFSAGLRATRWFGDDPFAKPRWRPFAFMTAGYAMSDLRTGIHVREDPTKAPRQGGNDLEQQLTLWKRAGDAFAGVGAGVTYPLGQRAAVALEVSAVGLFPFGAFLISPSLGVMLGF